MVFFIMSALASDGVRQVSLDEVADRSAVVALVRIADPAVEAREIEVALPTEPPRTFQWTAQVHSFETVEIIHRKSGPELGKTFHAVGADARADFDRHVRYEVEGVSKGLIHHRYESSLRAEDRVAGKTVVVFLGAPAKSSSTAPTDVAWDRALGPTWSVLAIDAPAVRSRVEKHFQRP